MIAVAMCGGRGTRMGGGTEKPLLPVGGVPMISRVIDALKGSDSFERIIAAVSPGTPATSKFLDGMGIQVIETPGLGYSRDLSLVLTKIRPAKALVVSADMPLLTPEVVRYLASSTQSKPVLSVVVRKEFVESLGFAPSVSLIVGGTECCHSGVGLFDTQRQEFGKDAAEEYLFMERREVAVNVNTQKELQLAENLLVQRAQDFS